MMILILILIFASSNLLLILKLVRFMGIVKVTRLNFSSILKEAVDRILRASKLRPLVSDEIVLLRCVSYSVDNGLPLNYSNISLRKCLLMYLHN